MKIAVNDERYGEIVYTESFWTSKKQITVNGLKLKEIRKNTFAYIKNDTKVVFTISGSYLFGAKILTEKEPIILTTPPKWYEFALSIFIFTLVIFWGNVPALCNFFPIVGGAIGGGISGAMAFTSLYVMKLTKELWLKLVICAGFFIATMLLCFAVAMLLLIIF